MRRRGWAALLAWAGLLGTGCTRAADPCITPPGPDSYAARIARVACAENALWFGPFIDSGGRLASVSVFETENVRLRDGTTPAWRRIVDYWKGSGLLAQMAGKAGAADCSQGTSSQGANGHLQAASCRAFLSDTPWSAAFVSYVMNRAGVPGFRASASHVDFVRHALQEPEESPYLFADLDTTPPAMGDLLCFSRMRHVLGHQGLREVFASGAGNGLGMHCDVVVAAHKEGDSRAYLVGGNVLQGVTLRVLPLNRKGMLWGLPRRTAVAPACTPANDAGCSFNRQDWVALLKLKPLPAPALPLQLPPVQPASPQCCTACPLPMPPSMQRCPSSSPTEPPTDPNQSG